MLPDIKGKTHFSPESVRHASDSVVSGRVDSILMVVVVVLLLVDFVVISVNVVAVDAWFVVVVVICEVTEVSVVFRHVSKLHQAHLS